jgi:phosphate-selective porin OprO/OprP
MLEEKLDQQEKQVQGIVPKMPPTADVPIVCKDAPCPPLPPPVFVSFTNGLKVESWDGAFSFRIGGRILVDGGVSSQPIQSFAGFPTGNPFRPFFPSHSATGYANQLGIRQARLQVEGTAFSDWDYKFQYDFVAPSNGLVVGGIRDAYLAWRYFAPWVTFQVGNFYEPFSLERTNSFLYVDFIERSLPSDLLAPSRHITVAAATSGPAPGFIGDPNWNLKDGIFSTSVEDGNPFAENVTTNAAGAVTAVNFGIPAGNSNLLNPVVGGHQY